jgi:hypothetical protein
VARGMMDVIDVKILFLSRLWLFSWLSRGCLTGYRCEPVAVAATLWAPRGNGSIDRSRIHAEQHVGIPSTFCSLFPFSSFSSAR